LHTLLILINMHTLLHTQVRAPGSVPLKVGGFDLIWDNGPIESRERERPTDLATLLGGNNDSKNWANAPVKKVFKK
jgi:hypothetical protein